MYKVGDYIMHKREVCVIKSIREKFFKGKDYYSISPVNDESLVINVPIDSPVINEIMSLDDANKVIENIPSVEIINSNEKNYENIYKELLETNDLLDLVKIIKTTYLRNKNRIENGKKIGDRDDAYFKKAEKLLYTSLGVSIGKSYDDCREYVINKIREKEADM